MNLKIDDLAYLSAKYRSIKDNCCARWANDRNAFYAWYEEQYERQDGHCKYCNLPGDTLQSGYGKYFREGRRGKRLEVDRIKSKAPYSPANCVLACYPCNNAKSDVFSYEDFIEIGKIINQLKTTPK
jgi:5-methylcytosine-specific restriction endonuclease McrA